MFGFTGVSLPCSPSRKRGVNSKFSFGDLVILGINVVSYNLPETNSLHLKMDGWEITLILVRPIFRVELLVLGSVSNFFGTIFRFQFLGPKNLGRKKTLLPSRPSYSEAHAGQNYPVETQNDPR